jgi:glutamate 5-kinase
MTYSPASPGRLALRETKRVVLKLGTRVLTHDDGRLALSRIFSIMEAVAQAARSGKQILIVSSGAVGLGRVALGLDAAPRELATRQACAAIGQARLMELYHQGFSRLDLVCGQVLLTQSDFDDRERYLNLRSTLSEMLRHGVVPIINENDAVATEELAFLEGMSRPVFGDNDRLSALVAVKLEADLLLLLTDVEGLYDRNPDERGARLLGRVEVHEDLHANMDVPGSSAGRGGMSSKVEAARVAARGGCHAIIASGRQPGVLSQILAGQTQGTWFPPGERLEARRSWIAFASAPKGCLHLDVGAIEALRYRGASLLAAGVTQVAGEFQAGDVVDLQAPSGTSIGRGIISCDATSARAWCSGHPPEGIRNHDALVHRDLLALEGFCGPDSTPGRET